jgi:Uma2 family endonuclease
MTTPTTRVPEQVSIRPVVPPLETGDHLTRPEFERRYGAMPELKKAELIEGVVYMPSAVRIDWHGTPHAAIMGWLCVYWARTPGVAPGDNATVRLDLANEPQPDALVYIEPRCGGRVRINEGYIEGAPELVAEVAASSASIDLNAKLRAYLRNGVREYLVWRVLDGAIDWFVLHEGQYQRLLADESGILRSEVFPGLWLDSPGLLRIDPAAVLQVLQQGLASPEHAAFVARLQQAGPASP